LTNPKLDEFVQKVKAAAPDNLKSVILYGSAVTGEFHSKHSDINVLCVLEQADAARIEALHTPVEWWLRQGHRAPLVFTLEELRRSADVFAIELFDMKTHHRMLYGEDVLAGLPVPLHYHAIQVERELRTDWLRLRQAVLTAPKKKGAHLDLMTSSFSAFTALFRHVLIALNEAPAANKREAIDRVGQFAHSDPAGFYAILDFREGKRKERDIDAEGMLERYFAFVEAVTGEFDRQLDARK
jgi:predicted nucleotidyltransferase